MTWDLAARHSRLAALQRRFEREQDERLQSTLAEELERDMAIIVPLPSRAAAPRADAHPPKVDGETAARLAFGLDDNPLAVDEDWKAKLAAIILLVVLGIPTLLGCAALLIALASWGR